MNKTVLDTDVLSAIIRKHPIALAHAQSYLSEYPRLTISIITRFEILRGLKAKQTTAQIVAFEDMCQLLEILPLTDHAVVRGADIYAELQRSGKIIGDADILIGATSLESGCEIATNNVSHFGRIVGLTINNWLTEAS